MNAQQQIQIKRIRNIVIAWTFLGCFITAYDHFLMHSNYSAGHLETHSFWFYFLENIFAGFTGGLLGGIVLTSINRKIRSKPYIYGLWWGTICFVLIVAFIALILSVVSTLYFYGSDFSNPESIAYFKKSIFDTNHLKNITFWALVTLITQFSLQISDKFGPGNLWNILTGKYHTPKKEERIFMFLDLKSSTTIAEKLGEEKYHEFLQDVFSDITDPVNNSKAEIYQYVGDEIVISWDLQKLKDKSLCLKVCFEIENIFEKNKEKYIRKYDTLPRFKAGAHIGKAIAGEIGIIKRDITYSGDLLNTTARIQGRCNDFESFFLISAQLKDYLQPDLNKWNFESKGFIDLKGKEIKVELLDVSSPKGVP